jgi:PAS domain S-box-containing protein
VEIQFSVIAILFIVSAAATAVLTVVCWRTWKSPAAPYFTLLFAAATIWNLGDAGEFLSITPAAKFLFVCMEYPGMVTVPVAWFLIVLYYTGNTRFLSKKNIALLFVIPVLAVAAVWTNPLHHLYYTGIASVLEQGTFVGVFLHGPLFWIFITWAYGLSAVGIVIVATRFWTSHAIYQYQIALVLAASLLPLAANIAYVARWGPVPFVNLSPLLFAFSGLLAAYGISRFQLLSLMPVAHDRVFSTIADGIIVVDDRLDICDTNPAAEEMLGVSSDRLIGQSARTVLPGDIGTLPAAGPESRPVIREVVIDRPGQPQYYEASVIPFDPQIPGRSSYYLIVLRNITRRKLAESALADASRKLALLNNITRHDILNQITALDCYVELGSGMAQSREEKEFIKKEREIISKIHEQIEFTREYQNLGSEAAKWQDLPAVIALAAEHAGNGKVSVKNTVPGIEVFADPMLGKVFSNLVGNAVQYGETITSISFTGDVYNDEFVVVCEDNGVGIPENDKPRLFTRGFGKHTGLGLFLSREILSITGFTIEENGTPGRGARFEIRIPSGAWRFRKD